MPADDSEQLRSQIRVAREDILDDLDELDRRLHHELPERVRDNALLFAVTAAAGGLILGLGGTKAIKVLLGFGVPFAVAAYLIKGRLDSTR